MHELLSYIDSNQPAFNDFLFREVDKLDPVVAPTAKHVLKAGGKRLRPVLTQLTSRALGYAGDNVLPMACALEFLHSATLLHDDILDKAELRRGLEAAHLVFGETETILAGDVLLALGNKIMATYGEAQLLVCISEAILKTATGEVLEIAHMRDASLSHERYLEIITGKTAFLIQAACRCGAILAGASSELEQAASEFGLSLGIAFQLVDDALDYSSTEAETGKPVGADLLEGKLTLPMLLFLQDMEEKERADFSRDFKNDACSRQELADLAARVRDGGYASKTRDLAAEYLDTARKALDCFPPSRERDMLGQALQYVLTRNK